MKFQSIKLTEDECRAVAVSLLWNPIPELCDPNDFWMIGACPADNMPGDSKYSKKSGCRFCNEVFFEEAPWLEECLLSDEHIDVLITLLEDNRFELPGNPSDYIWRDPFISDEV